MRSIRIVIKTCSAMMKKKKRTSREYLLKLLEVKIMHPTLTITLRSGETSTMKKQGKCVMNISM
jgi:hypothetical protein